MLEQQTLSSECLARCTAATPPPPQLLGLSMRLASELPAIDRRVSVLHRILSVSHPNRLTDIRDLTQLSPSKPHTVCGIPRSSRTA